MHIKDDELKELLLDSGLVTNEDIRLAEERARKNPRLKMKSVLVHEGKISENDLRRMEGYILGIPFIDLKKENIDPNALRIIPEPITRRHNIIAFKKNEGRELEVAMLDLNGLKAINFLKKEKGLKILPRLTDDASIKSVLLRYQKDLKEEFGDIIQKGSRNITSVDQLTQEESEATGVLKTFTKKSKNLPMIRVVETLLDHAILQSASDIHIEPLKNQTLIRYRIHGTLEDAMFLSQTAGLGIVARIKTLAGLKQSEKNLPQEGRFEIENEYERVSFRVSTLPTSYGEKVVLRLLCHSVEGYTLESLGFHGKALEDLHAVIRKSSGMILVSGPAESGKTTTLYTMLDILNTPNVNISTIEDPIEYPMERVNQTQVRPEIGYTFSAGFRSLLKQDPDIIMTGEIRDNEAAGLTVNAALTERLILSTLYANGAAETISRLINMKAQPTLLAAGARAIIYQRLVRKLDNEKERHTLSKEEIKMLGTQADLDHVLDALKDANIVKKDDTFETIPFYKPKTSSEDDSCGKIGVYEVLKVSSGIKDLIRKNAATEEIEKQAKAEGMMTVVEDGIFKAAQGLTSIDEVFRIASM